MISAILNNFISLGPRASPDEIDNEEDDATPPPTWMDDIEMSEEDGVGPDSNDEEILDFPQSDDDEGYRMMGLDIDPSVRMEDLVVPDVAVPDLVVVPELENYASTKVTQVSVQTADRGVSMLTGAYRIVRGVL